MTRRPHWATVGLVAAAMLASGCYGPFYLTRKVWKWNGEVSDNKWVVELVYLLTAHLIPVYGIAGLADAVIFNSVEFWTGDNPIKNVDAGTTPKTTRIVRGDAEAILTRDGDRFSIEQFQHGQPAASLRIERQCDTTNAMDQQGRLLFTAQTMADCSVVVTNATGKQVASYSADQAQRLLASAPH